MRAKQTNACSNQEQILKAFHEKWWADQARRERWRVMTRSKSEADGALQNFEATNLHETIFAHLHREEFFSYPPKTPFRRTLFICAELDYTSGHPDLVKAVGSLLIELATTKDAAKTCETWRFYWKGIQPQSVWRVTSLNGSLNGSIRRGEMDSRP